MSLLSLPPFATLSPARQRALYSDFAPQRTTNPPGFKANVAWWSTLLLLASERGLDLGPADAQDDLVAGLGESAGRGSGLVLDVGEKLVEQLRVSGGGRPLALGTVVEEMVASSSLVPTSTYLSASSGSGVSSANASTSSLPLRVASTLLVTPLLWSFRQLGLSGSSAGEPEAAGDKVLGKVRGTYIVRPTLEKLASQTISSARTLSHSLLSETLFSPHSFRVAMCPTLSAFETDILLVELERRGAVVRSKDGEVIKLTLDASPGKRETIGEVERGVLEMRSTIDTLQAQVADLEKKISERAEQAKAALTKGLKSQALSYLRSRKDLEAVLSKRIGSLGTLQGVLLKIDSSAGDVAILKAYETSTSTLRSLLALPELQLSAVEGTMDGLADALADTQEIEDAVRLGAAAAPGQVEEDELEMELEALVLHEKEVGVKRKDALLLEERARERERAREEGKARSEQAVEERQPTSAAEPEPRTAMHA